MHLLQTMNFHPILSSSSYRFRFPYNSQNRSQSSQTLNLDSFLSSSSYPCSLSCDSWNMSNLIHPLNLNCSDVDKRFAVCASKGQKTGNHFTYRKKDLASEDSLWKLYERWCNHFEFSRDLDEKYMRFNVFKESAKSVSEHNKRKDKSYTVELNKFSDRTFKEAFHVCTPKRHPNGESVKNVYDNSSIACAYLDGGLNDAVSGVEDQNLGYTLMDNKFADLTNEEFRARIKCMVPSQRLKDNFSTSQNNRNSDESSINVSSLPRSVDGRKKGAFNRVKDPDQCGNIFTYCKKDLASEDSLWKLYEKWCNHFEISRYLDEKYMRFNVFKENAKLKLYEDESFTVVLDQYADRTYKEAFHVCARKRRPHGEEEEEGDPFTFSRKDIASEGRIWKLYDMWCNHYGHYRDVDEKQKRFNEFKKIAKHVYKYHKKRNFDGDPILRGHADYIGDEKILYCICESCAAARETLRMHKEGPLKLYV